MSLTDRLTFEFDRSDINRLNSNHLVWLLNTILKLRNENLSWQAIQKLMDEKFPESEHAMLWEELIMAEHKQLNIKS